MTSFTKTARSNFVRQRRGSKARPAQPSKQAGQTARKAYHPASVLLPGKPRASARRSSPLATKNSRRNGYDIAFTLGRARVHAPAINIPQLGPRWVSAAMTLILAFMLYAMWTASPFLVKSAEVHGNQRLGAADINSMLGMIGQPIFKAIPAQIEANLHTAFPDLESIQVHVFLPSHITVDVVERMPALAWYQDGVVTWIDAKGVAFTPRGDVSGLVQVAANASPTQVPLDPALPLYQQKFIDPKIVQALLDLAPVVPAGMPMIFDPQYGIGWQDPRGWTVYVGQDAQDIPMKKAVYQAIVDTLTQQGVQPTLISVEYLNAPFYK